MIGFFDRVSRNREHGWAPFVWLVYSGFFFVQPIMDHVGRKQWLLDLLGFSVFLLLYAGLFLLQHPRGLLHIAGMVALGMIFIPWDGGASTFFIFAAAFTPFVMETQTKAIAGMLTIVAIAGTEGWLLHLSGWALFYSAVFPLVVGGGNLFFAERNRMNRKLRKANEEIEHLAKVAERERIARDLHDVLGHTLSVITLKSELAGKLMERDPASRGTGDPRSGANFPTGAVGCARCHPRLPLKGAGGGTGAGQMHAGNRRRRGSMRCIHHG